MTVHTLFIRSPDVFEKLEPRPWRRVQDTTRDVDGNLCVADLPWLSIGSHCELSDCLPGG